MKYIGGFFELEIPQGKGPWHAGAIALSTGRACFAAVLKHVKPKRVHMPFYMCDTVVEVARAAEVEVAFYALDHALLPSAPLHPESDELLMVMNYFGLQSAFTREAATSWGRRCQVDNTQAFFDQAESGCWTLCSARKFFGVPDGAYLYAPEPINIPASRRTRPDISHLTNRLAGQQQLAYRQCRRYEAKVDSAIRQMSELSERLLSAFDYAHIAAQRRANYLKLHEVLGQLNKFDARLPAEAVPYCYPLLLAEPVDRAELAKHRLYVPTIWQDVIDRAGDDFPFERAFANRLLPLPIDQRYTTVDMQELLRKLARAVPIDIRGGN